MRNNMAEPVKKTLLLIGIVFFSTTLWLSLSSSAQSPRDAFSKWRPTHELAGVRYVGSSACAQCHAALTAERQPNSMIRALEPVESCEILKANPRLNFRNGPYIYQIVREGKQSIYTISNGLNSISEPVLYCFGQGKAGQTYVFRHKGVFYESSPAFCA